MSVFPLEALVHWWNKNRKLFPWSQTQDPYKVWVSEVMLQQTVAASVIEPYSRWMKLWPNFQALAKAEERQVLREWEGLGYYSRARNLWRGAQILVAKGYSQLPTNWEELRLIPGIGDYTASALLSFCSLLPLITLDSNLKRVFQRLAAKKDWDKFDAEKWLSKFQVLWREVPITSRETNLALMQFGQQVCKPKSPSCSVCPLTEVCEAFKQGLQGSIPQPKVFVKEVLNTQIRISSDATGLWFCRSLKGRFSQLWRFPGVPQTDEPPTIGGPWMQLKNHIHYYTRYQENLEVWGCYGPDLDSNLCPVNKDGEEYKIVSWSDALNIPMPSVYRRIFKEWLSTVKTGLDC